MLRRSLFLSVVLLICCCWAAARADVLFESGTLGPTGVPTADLLSGVVPSSSIRGNIFNGVRFHFNRPVITTQVGGHFVASLSGTFFGAIVTLDNEDDLPDSNDLTAPDVLGNTLLTFPIVSDEVFGDLNLSLEPGWYALVFGSGLFGAAASGDTVRNGADIGDPSYIGYQQGTGWLDLEFLPLTFDNHRFVIKGQFVPEPRSIALAFMALFPLVFRKLSIKR